MLSALLRHRIQHLPSWSAVLLGLTLCLGSAGVKAQYNGQTTSADRANSAIATTNQSVLFPTTPDTLLSPGDQISIRVFDQAEYTVSVRLGIDGSALLPLIGMVDFRGLSVNDAETLLARKLQDAGMYRDPQVQITITEGPSSVVTLAGEMHGVFPVVGSRNLYTVISLGGGLPPSASRIVTIFRSGKTEAVNVDIGNDPLHGIAANVPVFPGDTIVVSRIGVVYVLGEFRNPSPVNMTNYGPLTLTQVAALAGGPVYDAKYSELHIIRTVGDHRTVVTLNIKNVLYGKAPDPIMQPNDIVFLPPSAFKASIANGSLGSILGIVSFGIAAISTFR